MTGISTVAQPQTQDMIWRCRHRTLDLTRRTLIMGIVNVTPDSFSDGGLCMEPHVAIRQALTLIAQGADLLDIGGESTRPGAQAITLAQELERVMPVIEGLRRESDIPISIDTTKAEVARAALEAGADIVNDISALRHDPQMAQVAASYEAGVVLMHMLGTPRTMQQAPQYDDVVATVLDFLHERMSAAIEAGIAQNRIVLDPGIGFGKSMAHNLELLRRLDWLARLPRPLLVGASRKSFIGRILDLPVEQRVEGTSAVVAASILKGARIVRVHDVEAMTRVVRMTDAIVGWYPAHLDRE